VNTGNQTVPLTITFDTTYSSVNGTTLQTDNPNAFNYINNQTAVVPRKLKSTDLPTKGGASSSTGSHSRSSTRSGSMTSGSANGQGLATSTATAATETPTGMRRRQSGMSGGGMTWSWTVPVFSSTVLQFDK
jgi:hypothetical protein